MRNAAKATIETPEQPQDLRGVEPVEVLALVEHHLQRADPQDEQAQADEVHRHARRGGLARAKDHPSEECRGDSHRHVDVEDPGPGNIVGDPATEQRPHYRSQQGGD